MYRIPANYFLQMALRVEFGGTEIGQSRRPYSSGAFAAMHYCRHRETRNGLSDLELNHTESTLSNWNLMRPLIGQTVVQLSYPNDKAVVTLCWCGFKSR